ncbi:SAM-dependent methyltransferase [Stieleria sp. JC731]|uniref:methyltransferase RsmF C-terminal domain-like protein n=1 Tax=Pirellulaceae TaxID=2691357 RepID=UPI001E28C1B5|nr:SAM-dependent methyltransferase [Stieleria sp. JC731]MCC9603059.1 SAM-dependent methyltransferase [Stieleria sp. JC731]
MGDLPNVTDVDIPDLLRSILGKQVDAAGSLADFGESLFEKYASIGRLRFGSHPSSLSFPTQAIDWYDLGFTCPDQSIRLSRTLDYAAGDFYLQDAGSMLALAACNADRSLAETERSPLVCDLCAAPGGKASALLENIGSGFLVANEPIRSRIAPLAFNLARTGSNRYAISSMDPEQLADLLGGVFDIVVVDAPCSGQALLGRGKQTLASITLPQIEHSAARAQRILAAAVKLLRPGGRLVFSTCTFAELENEAQVRWLIDQFPIRPLPLDRLQSYCSVDGSNCTYRLWPHQHQCAGSFAASLSSEATTPADGSYREPKKKRKDKSKTDVEFPDAIRSVVCEDEVRTHASDVVLWGWPIDAPAWVESIATCGPELAYRTGRTWKPSHQLARRRDLQFTDVVDVDDECAKTYLSGQPIPCDKNGWRVVRHQNRGLGWVKASGGIGKNHLPSTARLPS